VPTTPNPTPSIPPVVVPNPTPTPTPAPTNPVPTPVDIPMPGELRNRFIEVKKADIGFMEKEMRSALLKSNFSSRNLLDMSNTGPDYAMFNTYSPGHYSRRYTSRTDALNRSSGSGLFGYPAEGTFGSAGWWSTNFKDSSGPAAASKSEGNYYSKNCCVTGPKHLMGVITTDATYVSLKWGANTGIMSRNSWYDKFENSNSTTIVPEKYSVPLHIDGTLDIEALEHDIMLQAPSDGCFVALDLYEGSITFVVIDGDADQFVSTESDRVGRDVFEQGPLPIDSGYIDLPTIPTFNRGVTIGKPGVVTYRNTGQNSNNNATTLLVDRNKDWLLFADSCVPGGWGPNYSTKQAAEQKSGSALAMFRKNQSGNSWDSLAYVGASDDYWYNDTNFVTYSAFLAVGTASQLVGYVGPKCYDGSGAYIIASAYGLTSISPYAQVDGKDSELVPAPGGLEGIAKLCPSSPMAFIFDASVGTYGEITWASLV